MTSISSVTYVSKDQSTKTTQEESDYQVFFSCIGSPWGETSLDKMSLDIRTYICATCACATYNIIVHIDEYQTITGIK